MKITTKKGRILGFIIVLGLIGLISCSDKDNDGLTEEQQKEVILGKWELTTGSINGVAIEYEQECTNKKDYIEFLANNIMQSVYHEIDCESYADAGTYSINGNTLLLILDGEDGEFTLTTTFNVSTTELILEYQEDRDGDGKLDKVVQKFKRLQ